MSVFTLSHGKRKVIISLLVFIITLSIGFTPSFSEKAYGMPTESDLAYNLATQPYKQVSETDGDAMLPDIAVSGSHKYIVWEEMRFDNGQYIGSDVIFKTQNGDETYNYQMNDRADVKAYSPKVAASGSNVYVIWEEYDRSKDEYCIVFKSSDDYGESWSVLYIATSGEARSPAIAVTEDAVYVAYDDILPSGERGICVVKGSIPFRSFRDPIQLSSGKGYDTDPELFAFEDNIYIAWFGGVQDYHYKDKDVCFTKSLDNGTTFGPVQNLGGDPTGCWELDLSVYQEHVYVVWEEVLDPNTAIAQADIIFKSSHDYGDTFSQPQNISNTRGWSVAPKIDTWEDNVYVIWEDLSFGYDTLIRTSNDAGVSFDNIYLVNNKGLSRIGTEDPAMDLVGNNLYVVWSSNIDSSIDGEIFEKFCELNAQPIADAGPPQHVDQGDAVILDGSNSHDYEGSPLSYSWEQTEGPTVAIQDTNTTHPHFFAPSSDTTLSFQLMVNDGQLNSEPSTVDVWVGKGDFNLFAAQLVQAPLRADRLVQNKPTLLYLEIDCVGKPQSVPVKVVYKTTASGTETEEIVETTLPLNTGINKILLPDNQFIFPTGEELAVEVTLDPLNEIEEFNEDNNTETLSKPVKDTKPFKILYLPLAYEVTTDVPESPSATDMMNFAKGVDYLKAVFPVNESEVEEVFSTISYTPILGDFSGKIPQNKTRELYQQLDTLEWFIQSDNADAITKLVAVVRPGWFYDNMFNEKGTLGLAYLDLDPSIVEQQCNGVVMTHEISHTFDWVSAIFPHLKNVAAPGYWISKRQPMDSIDFMNPTLDPNKIDTWISKHTWEYLLDKLKKSPIDPVVIGIRGTISKDDTASLDTWYRFESTLDVSLDNPGEYTILYLDDSGNIIGQTGFDLSFRNAPDAGGGESDVASLSLKIPDIADTHKLVIKHGETILAERLISVNSPTVTITAPNGKEIYRPGEEVTVTWEASDLDGEPLSYVVSLSEDGGQTWVPFAMDIVDTQVSFKVPQGIDSNAVLVKVSASDGINTGEDVSDLPFTMTNTVPVEQSPLGDIVNVSDISGSSIAPVIEVEGDTVYVVWRDLATGNPETFFKVSYDSGNTFSDIINLSSNGGLATDIPKIAVSGSNVYVMWKETETNSSSANTDLYLAVSHDSGATFGDAINLTNSPSQVWGWHMAAQGDHVYVAWRENGIISFKVSHDKGMTFGQTLGLTDGSANPGNPAIIPSDSHVYVIIKESWSDSSNWYSAINLYESLDSGNTFETPVPWVSSESNPGSYVVTASDERMYIAWQENTTIKLKSMSLDGTVTSPEVILNDDGLSLGQIEASDSYVYVLMKDSTTETGLVQASSDYGTTFGPRVNVINDTSESWDMSASGNIVYVIWRVDQDTDPDIMLRTSIDGGDTFGPQSIVNDTNGSKPFSSNDMSPRITSDINWAYIVWPELIYDVPDDSSTKNLEVFIRKSAPASTGTANVPPYAQAGPDQWAKEGALVQLDASASQDSDQDDLSFTWTQVDGPSVQLSDSNTAYPTFQAPEVSEDTILIFQLIVDDGRESSLPDTTCVIVEDVPGSSNTPPVANNIEVTTEENTPTLITLTGSDIDEDSCIFTIITPPAQGTIASITPINKTTAQVGYIPDSDFIGSDSFTFTMTDGISSNLGRVSITVDPPSDNASPLFEAPTPASGETIQVDLDTTVTIPIEVRDPDADDILFVMPLYLPNEADFTSSTTYGNVVRGAITWHPTSPGTAQVSLIATDNHGNSSLLQFNLVTGEIEYKQAKTIGYWKNHDKVLEEILNKGSIDLGDIVIRSIDDAKTVFKEANAKDAKFALKAQLLATLLNLKNGSDPMILGDDIEPVTTQAVDYLSSHPEDIDEEETREWVLEIKNKLDTYNNSGEE